MSTILVTGGAGYIGSHTVLELMRQGHNPVVVDNLSNSSPIALERVGELAGKPVPFHRVDVADRTALEAVFQSAPIDAVIHFAGLKAVAESVRKPLEYYRNNLVSTLALCETMRQAGVRRLVFSSSATVYGNPREMPIREDAPLGPCTNPYGWSKLMIEQILRDLAAAEPEWSILLLRYFNPVGADASGRIGEDPSGIPNNLMPFIAQVAIGRHPRLQVFGDDYPTPDGTCIRDYIHVVDLARGHCKAVEHLPRQSGATAINLGTGRGSSVLQMIRAFEKASGKPVPCRVADRRPGDVAVSYADPGKAFALLGWQAEKSIDEMCVDAWRWQSANPAGYAGGSKP